MPASTPENIPVAALAATLAALIVGGATDAGAQVIPIRSVPVAAGDQFLVHPSATGALGGVRIAIDDGLLDPFTNPAKGARIDGAIMHATPTFYKVSDDNGGGRTLAIAGMAGRDRWFGGGSFALQELTGARRDDIGWLGWGPGVAPTLREQSATNLYLDGFLGRRFGARTAAAFAVGWADLGAIDGVEHLYALSQRIDQRGSDVHLRTGMLFERESGAALEALLLHRRFDVTHDVTYLDASWSDEALAWQWTSRTEENRDVSRTSGLQVGYRGAVNPGGWQVGARGTINHKSHPHIPNYEIQNIPRDPGTSWAYDLGVGLSRVSAEGATLAVDVVFEPVWSDTWAEAAGDTVSDGGTPIRRGDRTIDNEFLFRNAIMRLGFGQAFGWGDAGVGVEVRSVRYDLEQIDHIAETRRTQREDWMEWRPSLGVRVVFSDLEIRYLACATLGTGRPGTAWTGDRLAVLEAAQADFLVAPRGPLTLDDASVITSQVTVSLPIR